VATWPLQERAAAAAEAEGASAKRDDAGRGQLPLARGRKGWSPNGGAGKLAAKIQRVGSIDQSR